MLKPTCLARILKTALLATLAASAPVWAQISLTCDKALVHPGEHCRFTAAHANGEPGAFSWMVLEPDGGELTPGPGGTAEYVAPKAAAPRIVHIQAWEDVHPPKAEIVELKVVPDSVQPAAPAATWMVPKLEIYAGDPDPSSEDRTARFNGIRKLVYLDDPALPSHLNRHWVVGDGYGLQLVSGRGEVKAWLGGRERPALGHEPPADLADPDAFLCPGLAARPKGSLESNPLHLVFCEVSLHPHYACRLVSIEPTGRRLLTGGTEPGYQDGPAADALFGQIADLAMDREGTLYILDRGNQAVRKLSLDGKVTTLAGHRAAGAPERKDGHGAEAGFADPGAMALDPDTGDLYLADGGAIRKVTAAGDVTTLFEGAAEPGVRALDHPEGLALQGRALFIADRGNCAVRVLDLDGGALHTVAGDPFEQHTRRGPLAYYNPGRPAADCGALASPHCITFNGEGACLVGTGECLVALDMPPFQATDRLARREAPAEKKDEVKPPAAPAPAQPGALATSPRPALPPQPNPVAVQALQTLQVPVSLPLATRASASAPSAEGSH